MLSKKLIAHERAARTRRCCGDTSVPFKDIAEALER